MSTQGMTDHSTATYSNRRKQQIKGGHLICFDLCSPISVHKAYFMCMAGGDYPAFVLLLSRRLSLQPEFSPTHILPSALFPMCLWDNFYTHKIIKWRFTYAYTAYFYYYLLNTENFLGTIQGPEWRHIKPWSHVSCEIHPKWLFWLKEQC